MIKHQWNFNTADGSNEEHRSAKVRCCKLISSMTCFTVSKLTTDDLYVSVFI